MVEFTDFPLVAYQHTYKFTDVIHHFVDFIACLCYGIQIEKTWNFNVVEITTKYLGCELRYDEDESSTE